MKEVISMNWEKLAKIILNEVGGLINVENVIHCVTRLRLTFYDDSKISNGVKKIENLDEVLKVVNQGGNYK